VDKFELVIGNKAYSGWSLRPWLVLKHADIQFTETRIALYLPGSKEQLLRHSPVGKVPVLKHGALSVWESLAICEYLAERFPEARLWPMDPAARALARTFSTEMQSGFGAIRNALSFNCRAHGRRVPISPEVQQELMRVQALWRGCRETHGSGGPWLFGHFTIADAMFAPMTLRFATYGIPLDAPSQAYVDTVRDDPPVREWIAAAEQENEVIEYAEVGR